MSEEKKTLKQNVKELLEGSLTIPNLISVIRICLIPVIAVLYYKGYIWWSVAMIAISGLSDAVDGKIARKFNQVSALGKILDPVADKLTIFALAIVLFLKFREAQSEAMQARLSTYWIKTTPKSPIRTAMVSARKAEAVIG